MILRNNFFFNIIMIIPRVLFIFFSICIIEVAAEYKTVYFMNLINGNIRSCIEFKDEESNNIIYRCRNKEGVLQKFIPGKQWQQIENISNHRNPDETSNEIIMSRDPKIEKKIRR